MSSVDPKLLNELDRVEATANTHRAAAARLAAANGERERREAAYEEAQAKEMHRAAVSRLALDFRSTGMAHLAPRRG